MVSGGSSGKDGNYRIWRDSFYAWDVRVIHFIRWGWLTKTYIELRQKITRYLNRRRFMKKIDRATSDWNKVIDKVDGSQAAEVLKNLGWHEADTFPNMMYRKYLPSMKYRKTNRKPGVFRRVEE